jgi:hypothetical protein
MRRTCALEGIVRDRSCSKKLIQLILSALAFIIVVIIWRECNPIWLPMTGRIAPNNKKLPIRNFYKRFIKYVPLAILDR